MPRKSLSLCFALLLSLGLGLAFTGESQAQSYLNQNIPGGRMTSTTVPETPMVNTPTNLPTYLTSINYPLVYGSYAMWPYAAPLSFTGGGSLPSSLPDIAMRPTPVVTKAYAPALAPPATSAMINVVVPNSADLFFQGMKVPMSGTLRRFSSPELNPLLAYTYDVRAIWRENGEWVSQSQRLLVRSGDNLTITFPKTPSGPVMKYPDLPNPRPSPLPPQVTARPTPQPEIVVPPPASTTPAPTTSPAPTMTIPVSPSSDLRPPNSHRPPITERFTPPAGPPSFAPRP